MSLVKASLEYVCNLYENPGCSAVAIDLSPVVCYSDTEISYQDLHPLSGKRPQCLSLY